jgi:hypothetical protein
MEKTEDYVRVLRLVQYEGPRDLVEKQLKSSLHGSRDVMCGHRTGASVLITAVTLDQFPQVLGEAERIACPAQIRELKRQVTMLENQLRKFMAGAAISERTSDDNN